MLLQEGYQEHKWEESGDGASDPGWMLPLVILSRCFSTFLSTSAEAAFYEQQRPLRLAELVRPDGKGLLGLLRDGLWQVRSSREASELGRY